MECGDVDGDANADSNTDADGDTDADVDVISSVAPDDDVSGNNSELMLDSPALVIVRQTGQVPEIRNHLSIHS